MPMKEENDVWPNGTLKINAWFPNRRHFALMEYLLYTYDSFVADVGGYLGLLLGTHSVLNIARTSYLIYYSQVTAF